MIVFTIPGDDRQYEYPSSPEDVTFGKYLEYLDTILPQRPAVLDAVQEVTAEAVPHLRELNDYLVRAGMDKVTALSEALEAGSKYLESENTTGKGRKVVPVLIDALAPIAVQWSDVLTGITNIDYATGLLPYYAKVVAHFTGLPLGKVLGHDGSAMNYRQVEALYAKIMEFVDPHTWNPDDIEGVDFQGVRYVLPERLMEKATVIEFAEAAQFQASMQEVRDGDVRAMIDVCAVILRPEGVAYDDKGYEERKELFKGLPLADVLRVAFFLIRQSERLGQSFQIFTLARRLAKLKQVSKPWPTVTAGT